MSVRTLVALACLLVLLPITAAAQTGGGIKGGFAFADIPNLASELEEPNATTSLRTGFAVGAFATIGFGSVAIQPEVIYTQKGVKADVTAAGMTGGFKFKANFIDIPVLARVTFGSVVRGYVFGGPSVNFRVDATLTSLLLDRPVEEDVSEDVEKMEFALVVGGGVEVGPLIVEGRLSEGLTNLAKNADSGSTAVKSRTFLLLAGLRF